MLLLLLLLDLILGNEHQFEFFYLRVQLVKHFFLHAQHLVLHLHLLPKVLLADLLDLKFCLQLVNLADRSSILLLQFKDVSFKALDFRLLHG